MLKNLNKYIFFGILFTTVSGTLLHFVYQWSGNHPLAGLFSPVNESIWEHLKLLYYPMSIWVFIGYFIYGRKNSNYMFSALIGLVCGLISLPLIYCALFAVTKTDTVITGIFIFMAGVCVSYLVMAYLLKNYNTSVISPKVGILLWELFFLLFVVFTIFP